MEKPPAEIAKDFQKLLQFSGICAIILGSTAAHSAGEVLLSEWPSKDAPQG